MKKQRTELSDEETRSVCQTGVNLLSPTSETTVSMAIAMSGHLPILRVLLASIASGEVILGNPTPAEQSPPEGDKE